MGCLLFSLMPGVSVPHVRLVELVRSEAPISVAPRRIPGHEHHVRAVHHLLRHYSGKLQAASSFRLRV